MIDPLCTADRTVEFCRVALAEEPGVDAVEKDVRGADDVRAGAPQSPGDWSGRRPTKRHERGVE